MTPRCLGDRLADLADGRMTPAEAERAYAHVAACPACRSALDAHRTASSALRSLEQPAPSFDLLARLTCIAAPPVGPPVIAGVPNAPVAAAAAAAAVAPGAPAIPAQPAPSSVGPAGPAGVRPRGTAPGSPARRGRRVVLASAAGAAALALAAAVGGTTAGAGVVTTPRPSIAPVVETFAVEHAVSVDRMPLSGPRYDTTAFSTAGTGSSSSPAPAP